jgi:TonB family protein
MARADECPVRVLSVDLEGKGLGAHVYRYRVALGASAAKDLPDIGLLIHVGSTHPPIHVVAPHLQMSRGEDAYKSIIILERPNADVSGASVADTEQETVVHPCSSAVKSVGGESSTTLTDWDVPTVIVTVDDANVASPDPSQITVLSGESKEATFKNKGRLDYPQAAEENNVSGTARVLVKIGPEGQTEKEGIAFSSGSKLLDDAALTALNRSTFTGASYDGVPVEAAYYVLYEFQLGDSQPLSPSQALDTFCPAVLSSISLATPLFSGSAYWYDVGLTMTRIHFDSITLAVVGAHPPVKTLYWRATVSGFNGTIGHDRDSHSGNDSAAGAVFWPGDPLSAGIVQSVTPRSKEQETCKPYGAHVGYDLDVDSIVAVAETDRPWLYAPIIESVLPARFNDIAWPKYHPSATDPANAVAIDVRVHTTQSGQPLVAIVKNVSSAPEFAKAALAAAMASTYVIPLSADGAPLTQTFDVVYVYVPSK